MKGLVAFDPIVFTGENQDRYENAIHLLVGATRELGWISFPEADNCASEYRSFASELRGNAPERSNVNSLAVMPELTSRPALFKLFRLCCLCLNYGPRNLAVIPFNFREMKMKTSAMEDVIRTLQSHVYLVNSLQETYYPQGDVQALLSRLEIPDEDYSRVDLNPWSKCGRNGHKPMAIWKHLKTSYRRYSGGDGSTGSASDDVSPTQTVRVNPVQSSSAKTKRESPKTPNPGEILFSTPERVLENGKGKKSVVKDGSLAMKTKKTKSPDKPK